MSAHVFDEWKTPALVLPWSFRCALEANKEFALEVKEFIEIWEEEVYSILIDQVPL